MRPCKGRGGKAENVASRRENARAGNVKGGQQPETGGRIDQQVHGVGLVSQVHNPDRSYAFLRVPEAFLTPSLMVGARNVQEVMKAWFRGASGVDSGDTGHHGWIRGPTDTETSSALIERCAQSGRQPSDISPPCPVPAPPLLHPSTMFFIHIQLLSYDIHRPLSFV